MRRFYLNRYMDFTKFKEAAMTLRFGESKLPVFFRSVIFLSLIMIGFLTACAAESGPRDECGFVEPSQQDVNKALSFGGSAFANEAWLKSYIVEPYKVTVTRHNDAESAVASLEYLIYTCGYGQTELDAYFNDEGFAIVFEGYESYNSAAFCEVESLALYKFDLVDEGSEYTGNYWVQQPDDNHVLALLLVFPKGSTSQMDEYSTKLFPKLTNCQ